MRSMGRYRDACPALQRGFLLICDHSKDNLHVNSQAWGSGLGMSSRPTMMAKLSFKVTDKNHKKGCPQEERSVWLMSHSALCVHA